MCAIRPSRSAPFVRPFTSVHAHYYKAHLQHPSLGLGVPQPPQLRLLPPAVMCLISPLCSSSHISLPHCSGKPVHADSQKPHPQHPSLGSGVAEPSELCILLREIPVSCRSNDLSIRSSARLTHCCGKPVHAGCHKAHHQHSRL